MSRNVQKETDVVDCPFKKKGAERKNIKEEETPKIKITITPPASTG